MFTITWSFYGRNYVVLPVLIALLLTVVILTTFWNPFLRRGAGAGTPVLAQKSAIRVQWNREAPSRFVQLNRGSVSATVSVSVSEAVRQKEFSMKMSEKTVGYGADAQAAVFPREFWNSQSMFHAFQREKGLDRLLMTFEKMHFPSPDRCSYRHGSVRGYALCVKQNMFKFPSVKVNIHEFLQGFPRMKGSVNLPHIPYYPFPHILGFFGICDFVWARSCEHYCNHAEFRFGRVFNRSLLYWQFNPPELGQLRALLRQTNVSFFLLTHELDDIIIPDWVLEERRILKIFALNVPKGVIHSKLVPLPLGISKSVSLHLDLLKEARLQACCANATELVSTKFDIGAKGSQRYHRRMRLLRHLRQNQLREVADQATTLVPLSEFFRHILKHKFFISPPGAGLDAFRTWEVLLVGRVPVVAPRLHPFLFEDLPVIQMEWSNLTRTRLTLEWERLLPSPRQGGRDSAALAVYDVGKLHMKWWITLILFHCLSVP